MLVLSGLQGLLRAGMLRAEAAAQARRLRLNARQLRRGLGAKSAACHAAADIARLGHELLDGLTHARAARLLLVGACVVALLVRVLRGVDGALRAEVLVLALNSRRLNIKRRV